MGFNSGFKGLKCTRLKKSNFLLISEKGTKNLEKKWKEKEKKKGEKWHRPITNIFIMQEMTNDQHGALSTATLSFIRTSVYSIKTGELTVLHKGFSLQ